MALVRHRNAASFLQVAQAYLEERELVNSLVLGIVSRLSMHDHGKPEPYLATVSDNSGLAAVAILTPPYKVVVASNRSSCPAALAEVAHNLHDSPWPVPGVIGQTALAGEFAAAWYACAGSGARIEVEERLYSLERVLDHGRAPGYLRQATQADLDLVVRWMIDFDREALGGRHVAQAPEIAARNMQQGAQYLWEDNEPVAMVATTRDLGRVAAVSDVYTPARWRKRGYATSAVAALSQRLLDAGRQHCVLFTDLSNPTSNHIYQQVGYHPVADFREISFLGTKCH